MVEEVVAVVNAEERVALVEAALREDLTVQPDALATIQSKGYIFDQWPVDRDFPRDQLTEVQRWQGLAFTFYATLCDVTSRAERAFAEIEEDSP